jgi:hypothetical protein
MERPLCGGSALTKAKCVGRGTELEVCENSQHGSSNMGIGVGRILKADGRGR